MTSENEEAAASRGGESGTTAEAGEVRAAGGAATPAREVRLVLRRGARGIPWLIIGGGAVGAAPLVGGRLAGAAGFPPGAGATAGQDDDRPDFRARGRFFYYDLGSQRLLPRQRVQPQRQ